MRRDGGFLAVALAMAIGGMAVLAGCGGDGGSGPADDVVIDTPDAAVEVVPDVLADAAEEVASDVPREIPPAGPVFEKGLVLPLDSIPCTKDKQPTNACNHHGSSVAVQADGTVLVAWYTGLGEYSKDSRIVWARKAPGQDAFDQWSVLYDEQPVPEGNPVLHVDDRTGDLWLFYVKVDGTNWNDGLIRLIRSTDGGAHWIQPQTLRSEKNWMTRNHPIRLPSGEMLLPCYNETFYVPTFLISKDDFQSQWEEVSPPEETLLLYLGQIQPTVILRDDHSLFALMRNSDGPYPGHAIEAESTDAGRTWTTGKGNPLPNPGAAMEMVRMPSGAVMATFNNHPEARLPLAVALSDDQGDTWSAVANVVDACESGECSYPSIAVDPTDGTAWVTYTHARRSIGWVHVSEAWVRAKGDALAHIPNSF